MLHLAVNKGAAPLVTRLAVASIDVKLFLEAAAPTVSVAVIADRGAACEKRIFENALDARASRSDAARPRLPFASTPASAAGGKPARNNASQT